MRVATPHRIRLTGPSAISKILEPFLVFLLFDVLGVGATVYGKVCAGDVRRLRTSHERNQSGNFFNSSIAVERCDRLYWRTDEEADDRFHLLHAAAKGRITDLYRQSTLNLRLPD